MSVNIGAANADDAFYRYKMPKLQAKIEGRGNGIKTNVVNMVDIAKALARPPSYTTKYFGFELGAQTTFDKESGKAIVNGAHEARKLSEILEGFIKKFVQCYSCGNPETVMKIDKRQCILLDCKACGFRSAVDMRHKLTGFILKNPPEDKKDKKEKQLRRAEKERMEEGEKLDAEEKARRKEEKRKKKEAKEAAEEEKKREKKERKKKSTEAKKVEEDKAGDEPEEEEEDGEDDTVWQTDTSAEAANARMREQLSAQTAALVGAKEIKEKPLVQDVPNEDEDDDEEDEEDEMDIIIEGVRKMAVTRTATETVKYIRGLKDVETAQDKMAIVFMALLHDEPDMLQKNIIKHKAVLTRMAPDEASQKLLLACLEHMLTVEAEELCKQAALVLKLLYDQDIVEEESIIAWHEGGPKLNKRLGITEAQGTAVRKAAEPLVTWLKEAEEEDDDDD